MFFGFRIVLRLSFYTSYLLRSRGKFFTFNILFSIVLYSIVIISPIALARDLVLFTLVNIALIYTLKSVFSVWLNFLLFKAISVFLFLIFF